MTTKKKTPEKAASQKDVEALYRELNGTSDVLNRHEDEIAYLIEISRKHRVQMFVLLIIMSILAGCSITLLTILWGLLA